MKRGGFLARRTPLRSKTGFKRQGMRLKRSTKPKTNAGREKLPNMKTIRNKADSLLTPIIKARFPRCLLCGNETQVSHHFVFKSQGNRLRYELDNNIPLCHKCHFSLHANEKIHSSRIVAIKGAEWFTALMIMKQEYVKADVHWYIENYNRLLEIVKIANEKDSSNTERD